MESLLLKQLRSNACCLVLTFNSLHFSRSNYFYLFFILFSHCVNQFFANMLHMLQALDTETKFPAPQNLVFRLTPQLSALLQYVTLLHEQLK